MEALKSVGLTPLSVLAKKTEPKKHLFSLSTISISPFKNQSFSVSKSLQGNLILLSSFFNSELAKALTYDEALQQSVSDNNSSFTSDFDVNGVLDSVISFASENPIIAGGAAAVVAVPVVVSRLLSKPRAWGVESAKSAYAKLGDDENAQLLDIRAPAEIKQIGGPDIRGLKKKAVAVVYKGEDKVGFLKKVSLKFKEPEKTTLFILDKFDGNSELVAELVTSNGFKSAYAIKDGAEGPRGWTKSGLPWIQPKKTFSLDLSDLTGAIGDAFGEASDSVPLALGVAAAAAGLGLLAFAEVETILQILGSAALLQFASKKLLFAEDRKQTLQQIEELLNTNVAPKELVGDIQEIGKALLPLPVTSNAVAVSAETTTPPPSESSALKSESVAEVNNVRSNVEAASEQTPETNSVPKAEVLEESLPRSLSPYPNYPDYKPPSSPMPSQP
ncbi:rhodanese-like domain-containing protein 4 chloroplastic [Phtheirospermum japonicum]|uniref:Rhodanese-like domain-containing protein 4 chloroplastic n=1 Tax=Phtheirospermum japonicum TaxID=374723 RepID=A0A830C778_9LAMI|nr:rhodanese-like domain-containing protein 4 chloroplastic [Phtheirospermum japonicum]